MTMNDIAAVVVEYMTTLPNGVAISTSDAVDRIWGCEFLSGGKYRISDEIVDTMELFSLDALIRKTAGEKGLVLESSDYSSVPTGLPFSIPYVVYNDEGNTKEHGCHLIFQKEGKHTMTWFHLTKVVYSREYGDPTLPKLADMVSSTPDPCKDIILDYLGEHCIAGCPGIEYDVVDPKVVIGHGHLYADDKYFWTDCFANYVRKYNIPIPTDFRAHILEKYRSRKIRHVKHRLLNSISVTNQLSEDHCYAISIDQYGNVRYQNSLDCPREISFKIKPEDAEYIVHPITESFFCYDQQPTVPQPNSGYRWKIEFCSAKGIAYKAEGWPGEPEWRSKGVRDMFEFIERWTGKNLGSRYIGIINSKLR